MAPRAFVRGVRRIATVAVVLSFSAVACNLFIDPDSIVGGDDGVTPGMDGDVPDGTTTEASVDGPPGDGGLDVDTGPKAGPGRPPPDGSVPQCVRRPPGDAEALAVTWGGLLTPPPCPAGYAATPAATAYADFDGDPAKCDAGTCACPGVNGSATCNMVLDYYDNNACTNPSGAATDPLPTGICTRVATGNVNYGRFHGVISSGGASCAAATGAPITTKPDALWGTTVEACRPSTAGSAACADAGLVAMPPVAKEAFACYTATGPCAQGYSLSFTFSTSQAVNDTRACSCTCSKDTDQSGCNVGGKADFFAGNSCQGSPSANNQNPGCRPIAAYGGSVMATQKPNPAANAVTCNSGTNSTGNVNPSSPTVRYCCMSRCDSCTLNAGIMGGPCAAQYNACSANAECLTYRNCINAQCGGNPCQTCLDTILDGGPDADPLDGGPDGSAANLHTAFATCRTTACDPVCP